VLVIERLQNFGSTSDTVARRCALGKTLNAIFHLGAKQSMTDTEHSATYSSNEEDRLSLLTKKLTLA